MAQATNDLAGALDHLQNSLGKEIQELANDINQLADGGADVATDGIQVKDGDIVKLQYGINQMTKAAESGTSTWSKAQNISKQIGRQINQA
ncbi:MAG: hypothetical protein KKA31_00340 [Candidatus Margulisbacteria bacterium]|nr:hypothetical protein [Candidatus Margulisiibacteriota bacterium]